MRLPIGYALSYPKRIVSFGDGAGDGAAGAVKMSPEAGVLQALGAKSGQPALRFDFEPSDPQRFPCIRLAYEALAAGGTRPAVLSAANEVAVEAFVEGRVGFGRIPDIIEGALDRAAEREPNLGGVRAADREARNIASEFVEHIERSPRR
jgi:1-deoxy-D-xylulose-5-phosphate reductoisomerase